MMPIPEPNASHAHVSHVVPYFDYLDQVNAVVPLVM